MEKNESAMDRIIRAVLGLVIFYLAYTMLSGVAVLIGYVIAVAMIFTAVTGYCHIYKMMGISTKK